eukprot:gene31884-40240_t
MESFSMFQAIVGDLTGTVRRVVLYGADNQRWASVQNALRQGRIADGEVSLILERPLDASPAVKWEPEAPAEKQMTEEMTAGAADAAAAGRAFA